ncbi:MAG TPA: hypothetical protein G4N94_07870 [Caldilineae bacterium]|nr:hypothetical protein [Caldilineae bacterium]
MLADTLLLIRLYWTIDRRADGGTRRSSKIILILGVLLVVVLSGALGVFAASLTKDTSIIRIRAEILPGLLLTVVLFGVIFVGFSQALQALYLSDDLEKLLVAPVRSRAVMTAKLLSRMPTTISVLLLATIPALIGFGIGVGSGPLYYILGVLLILVTPLFGISLGALIAIFLVRVLPARRLNEWVGAASIVIGLLLSLLFYLPTLFGGDKQALDAKSLAAVEGFINHIGDLPLPSIWAGRALVAFGQGQMTASAIGALITYLAITVGLFLVVILLADRLYLSGWLRMQSSGAASQDIGEQPGVFGRNSLDFILGYKDWLLRIRDPRMLATLFTAVIMVGFALFMMLRPGDDGSSLFGISEALEGDGVNLLSTGVIISGLIYFAGYLAFTRLAVTSLSIERSAFYILKTAPISASQLLRAKTFGIFLPYAALATISMFVTLFIMKFSLIWMPFGLLVILIMGYGLFSFLVSLGFLYPNFEWEDPRRMSNRKSSIPSLVGSFGYSIVAIIIVMATYLVANETPSLAIPAVIMGLALLAGGTWFFVQWCTNRVEKAWPRIGAN